VGPWKPTAFYRSMADGPLESKPATADMERRRPARRPSLGLLARAVQRLEPDPNQRLARLTVEILRPSRSGR